MEKTASSKLIKVTVVTPNGIGNDGECSFECDSLRMTAQDNKKGKGGGSFGVRYGHTDALAALDKGEITALTDGNVVKKLYTEGGYAKISRDKVMIITQSYKEI